MKTENIEKANKFFEKAVKSYQKNDYITAKNNLEQAIKLNPNYAKAYQNLAILLSNDYFKDYNKAKIYFNKYEKLSKIDEKTYFKNYSNKINSINSINIENYFFLRNIEIKNLKDKKEIYFLGENGDGKTILLQSIFLHFNKIILKIMQMQNSLEKQSHI